MFLSMLLAQNMTAFQFVLSNSLAAVATNTIGTAKATTLHIFICCAA